MKDVITVFDSTGLNCNNNELFNEINFFSDYDELTICSRSSEFEPSIEKFLYDYFTAYSFYRFANSWSVSEKLYKEKLIPDFDEYEYSEYYSTHPSSLELSIYIRTLSMIQFAYVMLGYYIGLPRKFIKHYAKSEISVEQLRLLFYLIKDENVTLTSLYSFFEDFSLDKANELLSKANSHTIKSFDDIPVYEEKLLNSSSNDGLCNEFFNLQFFESMTMPTFEFPFIETHCYYPTMDKLKKYMYTLNFSQFAFVMLGYYNGLPQKLIDSYAREDFSYHSMEFLILKLSGFVFHKKELVNKFKRNNICYDKINDLVEEFKFFI